MHAHLDLAALPFFMHGLWDSKRLAVQFTRGRVAPHGDEENEEVSRDSETRKVASNSVCQVALVFVFFQCFNAQAHTWDVGPEEGAMPKCLYNGREFYLMYHHNAKGRVKCRLFSFSQKN